MHIVLLFFLFYFLCVVIYVTTHAVKLGPSSQGRAQQQHCRATQVPWMLGILVSLRPTEHWRGLQDLYSAGMIFWMRTHTRPRFNVSSEGRYDNCQDNWTRYSAVVATWHGSLLASSLWRLLYYANLDFLLRYIHARHIHVILIMLESGFWSRQVRCLNTNGIKSEYWWFLCDVDMTCMDISQ